MTTKPRDDHASASATTTMTMITAIESLGSELNDWRATFPGKTAQDVALMLATAQNANRLQRQQQHVSDIADMVDKHLGMPPDRTATADERIGRQISGLLQALASSKRRMSIYRRIWERLPGPTRDVTLSAMKCWSPEEYSVVMEDDTAPNEQGQARRDNPSV
jgi:hypothetical protein